MCAPTRPDIDRPASYTDDAARWAAVIARDAAADGVFVYGVVTTGIYCRPSCPSRRPKRENARFYALNAEAEADGLRPCKRCRPTELSQAQSRSAAVETACRLLESADAAPTTDDLAAAVDMSPHHFHRIFRATVGVTPKDYRADVQAARAAAALPGADSVADAAFAAGYGSLARFYDAATARLGLPPAALKAGAAGEVLVYGHADTVVGLATVAFSRTGVAAVRLAGDAEAGVAELRGVFPKAILLHGAGAVEELIGRVARAVDEPAAAEDLPLDIRGTAFRRRVWAALREIPIGSTVTYAELAETLGKPGAHRAVANANAANPIGVLVPCHRVIGTDGTLRGYRWGIARKATLLEREAAAAAE